MKCGLKALHGYHLPDDSQDLTWLIGAWNRARRAARVRGFRPYCAAIVDTCPVSRRELHLLALAPPTMFTGFLHVAPVSGNTDARAQKHLFNAVFDVAVTSGGFMFHFQLHALRIFCIEIAVGSKRQQSSARDQSLFI